MKNVYDLNYYELLEVSPGASTQEIHRAYERVRRIYEPNSIALYSLFTPEETVVIHQRIEDAYRTLIYEEKRKRYDAELQHQGGGTAVSPPPSERAPQETYQPQPVQPRLPLPSENRYLAQSTSDEKEIPPREPAEFHPPFTGEFTGQAIKLLREQRGLTLRDIADETKISIRYLESIEEECFKKLPARPYLRGFLAGYATALGCAPDRMVNDYLKRYDAAMHPAKR